MTTLLTALFYFWLVVTILLAAMWLLRRQDQLRGPANDDEFIDNDRLRAANSSTAETVPETDNDTGTDTDTETDTETDTGDLETGTEKRSDTEPRRASKNGTKTKSKPDSDGETESQDSTAAERQPASEDEPAILGYLEGVTLPFGLTATSDRIAEPDRHAIFISTHDDAEAVGTAFADEITKIGYEIEPVGLDRAKAIRDDQVLMMKISPQAGTRGSGKYRRYPTAGDDDVAIEIWTGQDSPPRLT